MSYEIYDLSLNGDDQDGVRIAGLGEETPGLFCFPDFAASFTTLILFKDNGDSLDIYASPVRQVAEDKFEPFDPETGEKSEEDITAQKNLQASLQPGGVHKLRYEEETGEQKLCIIRNLGHRALTPKVVASLGIFDQTIWQN